MRTEICLPVTLKSRALEVAEACDVSMSEVVIRCLESGLADAFVLDLIERYAGRRTEAPKVRGWAVDPNEQPTQLRLPAALKNRVREVSERNGIDQQEVALRCLQHGLFDRQVLALIADVASTREKKFGRTRGRQASEVLTEAA